MSTKNIINLDRENYLKKSENMLLSLSDKYFFKKRFLLGEGLDRNKVIFYMQMNESLYTTNCEMIKFIDNKIKGKLKKECRVSTDVKCCDTKIINNYE